MYPNANQLLELQKTHVAALQAFGNALFQATEKLTQLTINTSRSLLEDGAGVVHSLLSAKDPQELAAVASAAAQPGAEKIAAYSRSAYSIASATGAELSRAFESQLAEGHQKLSEVIDAAAKGAPAGSEPAIGILKTSLSAANTAFEAVAKAARQASETAESNIAAAVAVATDVVKVKLKKVS
jgi:phasin family protein